MRRARQLLQLTLQAADLLLQLLVFRHQLVAAHREMPIVPPPVEANLLGLVDRAHHQADADGQQLDFGDRNLDVAGDHQPLVEDAIENVDEPARAGVADLEGVVRHRFASVVRPPNSGDQFVHLRTTKRTNGGRQQGRSGRRSNPSDKDAKKVAAFGADTPMKRPAQPEEIAPALVSPGQGPISHVRPRGLEP